MSTPHLVWVYLSIYLSVCLSIYLSFFLSFLYTLWVTTSQKPTKVRPEYPAIIHVNLHHSISM